MIMEILGGNYTESFMSTADGESERDHHEQNEQHNACRPRVIERFL
jgi:hypothetical protein